MRSTGGPRSVGVFNQLIRAVNLPQQLSFVRACRRMEETHRALWQEISAEARRGHFWRGKLRDRLEDHPITEYESYRSTIEAAYHQGSMTCPLTGRPIIYWVESSGTTTGEPKLYPLTPEYRRGLRRAIGPIYYSLATRHRGF